VHLCNAQSCKDEDLPVEGVTYWVIINHIIVLKSSQISKNFQLLEQK
jgi:hypothetical protein